MTIYEAYNHTKKVLADAGVEDVVFEAKQIIRHITGMTNAEILTHYTNTLTLFQTDNLNRILEQRRLRYPLQYIFGSWSFYGNEFSLGPGVLCPRPDTECVVERCVEFLKTRKDPQVLDLCAGSGCIGISIAKAVPLSHVTMVEKYDAAKQYLDENIERNQVENARSLAGDVLEGAAADGQYDLIVSNPPYIAEGDKSVSPETDYEPKEALYAGKDGLTFYRAILSRYKNSLKQGGMLIFEVGASQSETVEQLIRNAGFPKTERVPDYNEIERAVCAILE